jgi:hypothetical protein
LVLGEEEQGMIDREKEKGGQESGASKKE